MAYPFTIPDEKYDILYWAEGLSNKYEGDKIEPKKVTKEPEIVYYHRPELPKCLGIQGHPEMLNEGELWRMLNKLLVDILNENRIH